MNNARLLTLKQMLWPTLGLVMVAAPHAVRLPLWLTLLTALLIGWRVYLARARLRLPPRAVLLLVVAAATAGVYVHFGAIFGRDAGVALLVVMLALKVLEMRSVRDGMLLSFLAYFLVITNFLYSQTIPTALYMLLCVWIITGSMIGLQYASEPRSSLPQLRTSAVLLAQSVPLMLALFVLFPRVQGPLWGMPADANRGQSGLSDTMSPGSLSELTLSDAVAFRATFSSAIPSPNQLYWRGPVLWEYDGRTWHAARPTFNTLRYEATYNPVHYTVTIEPHGKTWLFALDLPGRVPQRALASSDLQLISLRPVTQRLRYEMVSFLQYTYGRNANALTLERARRLPTGFNPRTIALASALRERYPDDRALVQAVLNRFNKEGYVYTLAPPALGENSVDQFLFETRSGFCEHYASAFAVLLRAAGLPVRVITGYLGGELNPIGDYMIVRQADAHAWTEVWFEGEGWVRIDPTAAVAPARVERGVSAAVAPGSPLPLFMRSDSPLLRQLRLTWDSVANSWNQWVLGYTPERQRSLLTRVGLDDATWRTLALMLLAIAGAITLVLALFTLRRLRTRHEDPAARAYARFCMKLRRRGLPREKGEGPLDYALRVSRARPDLGESVQRITELYVSLRYGNGEDADRLGRLKRLTREFAG